ncbi:MAG TPA: SpvB/TcaC N-terminal domain-containing protein [Sandaracinaceae bacterium]
MYGLELTSLRLGARRAAIAAAILSSLFGSGRVAARTGVSDDRVSLPDGPGSIEGLGDNVSTDGNMGAMTYSIPIELPQGYEGMTPELARTYSSAAGNGIAGVGWSLRVRRSSG